MCGQARKAVFMLRRVAYGFGKLPLSFLSFLFKTLVAPILLYGAEVWGPFSKASIDTVERKFYKMVLGLPIGTASAGLAIELNRAYSTYWRAQERALSYWLKIRTLPPTRLAKMAMIRQFELAEDGVQCWASKIREWAQVCEIDELCDTDVPVNIRQIKKNIREKLERQAYGEALAEVSEMSSLADYRVMASAAVSNQLESPRSSRFRRHILAARLNVPTFVQFTTVLGHRAKTCKLCSMPILNHHLWLHVLKTCITTADLRRTFQIEVDNEATADVIYSASDKTLNQFSSYFTACHKRMKTRGKAADHPWKCSVVAVVLE